MKFNTIFLILFCSLFCVALTAQNSPFDRGYRTSDNSLVATDMCFQEGTGYFILSFFVEGDDPDNFEYADSINITSLDVKGDESWTKTYSIQDTFGYATKKLIGSGSISLNGAEDGLIINIECIAKDSMDGFALSKSYMLLSTSGDFQGLQSSLNSVQDTSGFKTYSDAKLLDSLSYFGSNSSQEAEANGFDLSSINGDDQIWLNRNYTLMDTFREYNESLHGLAAVDDTTLLTIGNIIDVNDSRFSNTAFLSELNGFGDLLWSVALISNFEFQPNAVVAINDTVFAFAGYYGDDDAQPLVGMIDKNTGFLWAKSLELIAGATFANFDGLIFTGSELIAGGVSIDTSDDSEQAILVAFDLLGNVVWNNTFASRPINVNDHSSLVMGESGGGLLTNWAESIEDDSITVFPRLIQFDELGSSSCEDTLNIVGVNDVFFSLDTLVWSVSENNDESINWKFREVRRSPFSIPTLSLEGAEYCPNTPFEHILVATTEGAVSYVWMRDGEFAGNNDSLVIMDLMEYTVQVRVEDEFCFTLCDTIMLTEVDSPMVSIIPDFSQYCTSLDRPITLTAQVSGGRAPYTYLWGDGETTRTINVNYTSERSFTVTVEDDCGTPITAVITPQPPTENITLNSSCIQINECGGIRLNLGGSAFQNIEWSNGETGVNTIDVFVPDTYTAEGIDGCLNSYMQAVMIDTEDLRACFDAAAITNCSGGKARSVVATPAVDLGAVDWSTGVTATGIVISESGTYSYIATDDCGNALSEVSFEVSNSQLDACPEESCLEFPDIFMPNSQDAANQTFRAFDTSEGGTCIIENYNIQIFNRWNERVFDGNIFDEGWNGRYKEADAPSGMYVFVASYDEGGEPCSFSGNFTLLR